MSPPRLLRRVALTGALLLPVLFLAVGAPGHDTVTVTVAYAGGPAPADRAQRGPVRTNGRVAFTRLGHRVAHLEARRDRAVSVRLRPGLYGVRVDSVDGCARSLWVLPGGSPHLDIVCSIV